MVEFRLYYDEHGKVSCYTCENLPGNNYLVITKEQYAESNPYIRIVDGEIVNQSEFSVISKLVESSSDGIECHVDDVCVLTNQEPTIKWKVEINEFRNC